MFYRPFGFTIYMCTEYAMNRVSVPRDSLYSQGTNTRALLVEVMLCLARALLWSLLWSLLPAEDGLEFPEEEGVLVLTEHLGEQMKVGQGPRPKNMPSGMLASKEHPLGPMICTCIYIYTYLHIFFNIN